MTSKTSGTNIRCKLVHNCEEDSKTTLVQLMKSSVWWPTSLFQFFLSIPTKFFSSDSWGWSHSSALTLVDSIAEVVFIPSRVVTVCADILRYFRSQKMIRLWCSRPFQLAFSDARQFDNLRDFPLAFITHFLWSLAFYIKKTIGINKSLYTI